MANQESNLKFKVNYPLESFIGIVLFVIGLLTEFTAHNVLIQRGAVTLVIVSIAMNLWVSIKSARKAPLAIEPNAVKIRNKEMSAPFIQSIVLWKQSRTIHFTRGKTRFSGLQLRADEETFDKALIKLRSFAKANKISFELREPKK